MRYLPLAITLLLTTSITLADSSNSETIERETQHISETILSPFCPGRSLHDCPSESASELKDEIRSLLTQGKSKDDVIEILVSRFGEKVRGVPGKTGFSLVAWTGPFFFIVGGGALLIAWLSRSRGSGPKAETTSTISPEMEERIRREIR